MPEPIPTPADPTPAATVAHAAVAGAAAGAAVARDETAWGKWKEMTAFALVLFLCWQMYRDLREMYHEGMATQRDHDTQQTAVIAGKIDSLGAKVEAQTSEVRATRVSTEALTRQIESAAAKFGAIKKDGGWFGPLGPPHTMPKNGNGMGHANPDDDSFWLRVLVRIFPCL